MTHPPAYDPLDTVRWMLEEARAEPTTATHVTDDGRARKKTTSQRSDDRVRFDTLCAVLWNVTGRVEPLEAIAERELLAA